jgi:hypothetical protein
MVAKPILLNSSIDEATRQMVYGVMESVMKMGWASARAYDSAISEHRTLEPPLANRGDRLSRARVLYRLDVLQKLD